MAHPQIAVFARLADKGAQPVRKIEGHKTLLNRATHGVAYDDVHDEIFAPAPFTEAVLTFRGGADGDEAPIRVLRGPNTQVTSPNRLAVDPVHNELFIVNDRKILVFHRDADGDDQPIRSLEGPNTELHLARSPALDTAVGVDPIRNLLVVTSVTDYGARFLIFHRTDQGDAKPIRTIAGGPKAGFRDLAGPFALYPPRGWIVVGDQGDAGRNDHTVMATDEAYVGVWSVEDSGDVPPRWRIGGPKGIFQMPHGIALNPKHKELIVTEKRLNAVLTFYFPEMF